MGSRSVTDSWRQPPRCGGVPPLPLSRTITATSAGHAHGQQGTAQQGHVGSPAGAARAQLPRSHPSAWPARRRRSARQAHYHGVTMAPLEQPRRSQRGRPGRTSQPADIRSRRGGLGRRRRTADPARQRTARQPGPAPGRACLPDPLQFPAGREAGGGQGQKPCRRRARPAPGGGRPRNRAGPTWCPWPKPWRCLPFVRGKANPKSSTGRLDVFTRVITDYSYRFDEVAPGYHGQLYVEIVPLSFAVRVRQGLALNQLRLMVGRAGLDDGELRDWHHEGPLLYIDGRPANDDELATSGGLFLSLDLGSTAGTARRLPGQGAHPGPRHGQAGHPPHRGFLGGGPGRGGRPGGPGAGAVLPAALPGGCPRAPGPRLRDDRLRPDQR